MFHTKVAEKIKTHFLTKYHVSENLAIYEVMWKYTGEPDKPQMTIWRMRIAYAILIVFPLQQWLHEQVSMLRYAYSACLVLSDFLLFSEDRSTMFLRNVLNTTHQPFVVT